MPVISVTRLRVRTFRFLPGFALHTLRALRQVRAAPGFRGGTVLRDRDCAFWTLTAWDDADSLQTYLTTAAHRAAMPHLAQWCDEACVVRWEQEAAALPSWPEADRRMRDSGRTARVRSPSPLHATLSYRPPRFAGAAAISLRPAARP